jgi:hypothetical protein
VKAKDLVPWGALGWMTVRASNNIKPTRGSSVVKESADVGQCYSLAGMNLSAVGYWLKG